MKILLIVLGAILILILLVVVTGVLLPKHHIATRAATYRATPEQLFAYIAGPQNWRPDVLHSELDNGPSGQRILRESLRDGSNMTYEITDSVFPRSLTRRILGKNLPFDGSWTYTLTPTSSGAKVRITEDANIYNPVFRFMSRFILGYTGSMDKYLQALGQATGQQQVNITN
jgi:Polyketide cyclase / dehydrase and lipid transport